MSSTKRRTLRPAPGRIVIRKLEGRESRLEVGDGKYLILPAGADPRYEALLGVVEQESPPHMTSSGVEVEPSFRRGQVVLFSKFAGSRVEIDHTEFYVLSEQQVIAELMEVDDAPDASAQPTG